MDDMIMRLLADVQQRRGSTFSELVNRMNQHGMNFHPGIPPMTPRTPTPPVNGGYGQQPIPPTVGRGQMEQFPVIRPNPSAPPPVTTPPASSPPSTQYGNTWTMPPMMRNKRLF